MHLFSKQKHFNGIVLTKYMLRCAIFAVFWYQTQKSDLIAVCNKAHSFMNQFYNVLKQIQKLPFHKEKISFIDQCINMLIYPFPQDYFPIQYTYQSEMLDKQYQSNLYSIHCKFNGLLHIQLLGHGNQLIPTTIPYLFIAESVNINLSL